MYVPIYIHSENCILRISTGVTQNLTGLLFFMTIKLEYKTDNETIQVYNLLSQILNF